MEDTLVHNFNQLKKRIADQQKRINAKIRQIDEEKKKLNDIQFDPEENEQSIKQKVEEMRQVCLQQFL